MPEIFAAHDEKESQKKDSGHGKARCAPTEEKLRYENPVSFREFGPRLKIIKMNDQVRELQTILRDK